MSLSADVRTQVGSLALEVGLELPSGELVAVLGPNGAGKTSLLRTLAGLLPLRGGRVVLDDEVLDDVDRGIYVEVRARPIGFVFQDYLLFPHLSALDNVAFGLRARGVARTEARRAAERWLDDMGLADHTGSKPGALSGGQAQRVALARALAIRPRLLLLDEPLAALDAGARTEMRRRLIGQLRSFDGSSILVTHDPIEALSLADQVVVLENGEAVQSGRPEVLRARPRTKYVADLVGVNLFRGRARGTTIELPSGVAISVGEAHRGDVIAVVHPRAVALYRQRPEGTPRNVWRGTVEAVERLDDRVRVRVGGAAPVVAEVTPAAVSSLGIEAGIELWASVKATEFTVYAS